MGKHKTELGVLIKKAQKLSGYNIRHWPTILDKSASNNMNSL